MFTWPREHELRRYMYYHIPDLNRCYGGMRFIYFIPGQELRPAAKNAGICFRIHAQGLRLELRW